MHETLTSFSFWFYSALWFAAIMMFTPPFERWSWKQAIFAGVISGPIGWILTVVGAIFTGLAFLWELLQDKPKKS